MGGKLELAIAILNGAIGDYLDRTKNGLRTELSLVRRGELVPLEKGAFARAFPEASPRVVVFVPGLMCTEDVWELPDRTGSYPAFVERDLGVTALTVRYNTGRSIPHNGVDLDLWLTELVGTYPVPLEEIMLLGFSMGGLVVRSACHFAKTMANGSSTWLPLVSRCVYVGTPHRGAPLERAGRVLSNVLRAIPDPYTRLAADLANLRSAGVKDLGDADLRHEDAATRVSHLALKDPAHPVPLLPEIDHYLVAGTLSPEPFLAELFGDSLVPVTSGTFSRKGDVPIAPSRVKLFPGLSHMTLAHHPLVYEAVRAFLDSKLGEGR